MLIDALHQYLCSYWSLSLEERGEARQRVHAPSWARSALGVSSILRKSALVLKLKEAGLGGGMMSPSLILTAAHRTKGQGLAAFGLCLGGYAHQSQGALNGIARWNDARQMWWEKGSSMASPVMTSASFVRPASIDACQKAEGHVSG